MQYWQSCHDPECRLMGFKGRTNDLPDNVRCGISEILLNKAIQVDEQFENALMALNFSSKKGKKGSSLNSTKAEDDFDLDEDFISALMKLDLSNEELPTHQKDSSEISSEESDDTIEKTESDVLEESFDASFGLALVSALKEDPSFCP